MWAIKGHLDPLDLLEVREIIALLKLQFSVISVYILHGAVDMSVACDFGISWLYSIIFFIVSNSF